MFNLWMVGSWSRWHILVADFVISAKIYLFVSWRERNHDKSNKYQHTLTYVQNLLTEWPFVMTTMVLFDFARFCRAYSPHSPHHTRFHHSSLSCCLLFCESVCVCVMKEMRQKKIRRGNKVSDEGKEKMEGGGELCVCDFGGIKDEIRRDVERRRKVI